jgi:hypothetical protein
MSDRKLILISFGFLLFGLFFFLIRRQWLIFRWIPIKSIERPTSFFCKHRVFRKKILLYYLNDGLAETEPIEPIWGDSKESNIKSFVGSWFSFVYQERLISKRVLLESVALSESGDELFLSVDQPFLDKNWSIHKKYCLIDCFLKTIANSGLKIQLVTFLVKHEKMYDDHLDFSRPWPVSGF